MENGGWDNGGWRMENVRMENGRMGEWENGECLKFGSLFKVVFSNGAGRPREQSSMKLNTLFILHLGG